MTVAEAKRRKRARRAARAYLRQCDGDADEIGFPGPGLVARLVRAELDRRDRRDGGPFDGPCPRCNGSGIDPGRFGYPGEVPCDPELCSYCGGAG
jgi:hypothetical protein